MIPKTIHFCWFGGKTYPELVEKCISSWKRYCHDYEIVRWDESNTDLTENEYIKEAYENQQWAFVTDFIRLKVLYEQGGIYFDTDVELCKPLDEFLDHQAFSGFEDNHSIPTGIMASVERHPFFARLLSYYEGRHFLQENGSFDRTTNVATITGIALNNGFIPNDTLQTVCGITFYPHDYFCPKSHLTGQINITENTVCIHHFAGSWKTEAEREDWKVSQRFNGFLGEKIGRNIGEYVGVGKREGFNGILKLTATKIKRKI